MPDHDFSCEVDRENRTVTIQGVKFSWEFFQVLGHGAKGTRVEIGERSDGVVTLHTVSAPEVR